MSRTTLVTLGLLLAAATATASPTTKEAWIVNGGTGTISVIDLGSQAVTRTIPLPQQPGAPEPHGITFSTVDGATGEYAFVAHGERVYVIEADTAMIVSTVGLSQQLGLPLTIADLDAAPSRPFEGPGGTLEVGNRLYAAADVRPQGQPSSEPWFVVLDQQALTGVAPAGSPVVLAAGPLVPQSVPPAARGAASGVTVLAAPEGGAHERAWFTTGLVGAPSLVRSIRVSGGEPAGSTWSVDRVVETTLPAGADPPAYLTVGAPYDREVPVLPTGVDGRLLNLDTGGTCEIAGSDLRQVALAGPAPGAVQLLALDAATDRLHRVNPVTCDFDSFDVAAEPVAIAIDEIGEFGTAIVVSRGADTVSIVETDGTSTEVLLPAGSAPKDGDIRVCCRGCTVSGLTLSVLGADDVLNWSKYGCDGCLVQVFCQCEDGDDTSCPCYCPTPVPVPPPGAGPGTCYANLPPSGPSFFFVPFGGVILIDGQSETPWIHLGNSPSSTYTHTGAAPFGLRYTILPDVP